MAIWHAGMPICILYFKLSFVVKGKMGKYNEGICAVFALKPPNGRRYINFRHMDI